MKQIFYFLLLSSLITYAGISQSYAKDKHTHSTTSQQHHTKIEPLKPINHPAQIEVYEAHGNENDYVITLYPHQDGAALIAYNAQSCQANSYGTTVVNPQKTTEIEFTSKEDPHCKIILQKINSHQLKILSETPPCRTWHGDSCNFTTLSTLNRIYPQ